MRSKKNTYFFLSLIIISLAISPAFALGEGNRNLLLIGMMSVSPLIFIINKKFYQSDIILLLFMASVVSIPLLFQQESMRWSTVLFSLMFCFTFLVYKQLLYKSYFTTEQYLKLLKIVLYAYTLVLLIQQFCVLTGLPIFNISSYNPLYPFKLNSLAAEPSHSGRIIALLMYSYITISELILKRKYNFKHNLKKDKWVWLAFLWAMLTMGSATAIVFTAIVLLKFVNIKRLIPIAIIIVSAIYIVNFSDIYVVNRASKMFIATLTLDTDAMIAADHSGSIRLAPAIMLAKMVDITSLEGWFGHGIDSVSTFMSDLIPGVPEGFSAGGMFQLWYEYGFLSFILFVAFSFLAVFKKNDYLNIVFWFMLVFMYGVNGQIVWLCILLLFTNKFFFKKLNHGN